MSIRPETDLDAVTRLLGRAPAGAFTVVVRRTDGTPAVIENDTFLEDGRPMPTRYWLVDKVVREDVSRLEAAGGVRRATAEIPADAVAETLVSDGFHTMSLWALEADTALRRFLESSGWAADGARGELDVGTRVPVVRLHTAISG